MNLYFLVADKGVFILTVISFLFRSAIPLVVWWILVSYFPHSILIDLWANPWVWISGLFLNIYTRLLSQKPEPAVSGIGCYEAQPHWLGQVDNKNGIGHYVSVVMWMSAIYGYWLLCPGTFQRWSRCAMAQGSYWFRSFMALAVRKMFGILYHPTGVLVEDGYWRS